MLRWITFIALLIGLAVHQAYAGPIYRWVDENGVEHFGSRRPPKNRVDEESVTEVAPRLENVTQSSQRAAPEPEPEPDIALEEPGEEAEEVPATQATEEVAEAVPAEASTEAAPEKEEVKREERTAGLPRSRAERVADWRQRREDAIRGRTRGGLSVPRRGEGKPLESLKPTGEPATPSGAEPELPWWQQPMYDL